MKKHFYILAVIAAISLGLTACTEPENDTQNSETQTFNQITSSTESLTTTKAIVQTEIAADNADVTTTVDYPHTEPVPGSSGNAEIPQYDFEDSQTEPYLEPSSQTEPYQEEWSDTDVISETDVYIAHTEPLPGDENIIIDIPQDTTVDYPSTEPVPGESGVGDIPQN
jgi:hypothetical protein